MDSLINASKKLFDRSGTKLNKIPHVKDSVEKKVLVIIHNPVMENRGGKKLSDSYGWRDPDELVVGYIESIKDASYGYLNYKVVERIEVDEYPLKKDGFAYTDESFAEAWEQKKFHDPDAVDYHEIVRKFDILNKVKSGQIDEVFLMSMPFAGYWESHMGGPRAFWCNSGPLENTDAADRRFIIMGFNYERQIGEMLESFGHRVESIMDRVYKKHDGHNYWKQFIRYDKKNPSEAECGNVHFAPNSVRDYDWGNTARVESYCDDWLTFPNLPRKKRTVDCSEWGNGGITEHHMWWLKHLPHAEGDTDGIANNWWHYIADPNLAP